MESLEDIKAMMEMRDLFRDSADVIDELIELVERQELGEDVVKEVEAVTGRFILKMMKLQSLSNK